MKTIYFRSLVFALCITVFSCSKNNGNNNTPRLPDTLSAGWAISTGTTPDTLSKVFFTTPSNGYAISTFKIYKSTDGGVAWNPIYASATYDYSWNTLAARGMNASFLNGTNSIYYSLNAGSLVNSTIVGLTSTSFTGCDYASDNTCYASSYRYLWKSVNGGASFDSVYNFGNSATDNPEISFIDEDTGWIKRNDSLFKTNDAGLHWNYFKSIGSNSRFYILDGQTSFITYTSYIQKTTDGGTNWETTYTFPSGFEATGVFFVSPLTGYCHGGPYLYRTTDGGYAWEQVVKLGNGIIMNMFFLDEQHGWPVVMRVLCCDSTNKQSL